MRKLTFPRLIMGCGVAALALGIATGAQAQEGVDNSWSYWLGRSKAAGPACPGLEWNVVPVARGVAGPVKGVIFYSDMSGISRIAGTIAADGKITGELASVSGNGPAGTVTGMRGPEVTHIELRGKDCANATFNLPRWGNVAAGD